MEGARRQGTAGAGLPDVAKMGRSVRCRMVLAVCLALLASCGEERPEAPEPGPLETSAEYVIRFLPRYYTHKMQTLAELVPITTLVSISAVTPVFKNIVAPNDDTVYTTTLLDLSAEPVVLTVPETALHFSVQVMDLLTEVLPNDIGPPAGRSYAFVGPEWSGRLPAGMQRIDLSVNGIFVLVRANRNRGDDDVTAEARELIHALTLRRLSETRDHRTLVLPPLIFAQSNKLAIEREARETPLVFLANLREAVRDPLTPLTPSDLGLMDRFDRYFQDGSAADGDPARESVLEEMARGMGDALFGRIRDRYFHSNATATGWQFFRDTGRWGNRYLDRAAVAHYCLGANIEERARYYLVHGDERGTPLSGEGGASYEIRFPPGGLPPAGSFWSLTAYNNDAISFIPNDERQYNVPSYRQGLVTEPDGSLVIHLQQDRPPSERVPNWLPIDRNPFHLRLRVYEPLAPYGAYEPPAVRRR